MTLSFQAVNPSNRSQICCLVLLQVLERVKDPLQTLVSRDHFETAYAVLAHFHLIAQRAPILFSGVSKNSLDTEHVCACGCARMQFSHLHDLATGLICKYPTTSG